MPRRNNLISCRGTENTLQLSRADRIANVLRKVPGASEVKVEQTTGLPMLTVQIDREQAARYGLNVENVQEIERQCDLRELLWSVLSDGHASPLPAY